MSVFVIVDMSGKVVKSLRARDRSHACSKAIKAGYDYTHYVLTKPSKPSKLSTL